MKLKNTSIVVTGASSGMRKATQSNTEGEIARRSAPRDALVRNAQL